MVVEVQSNILDPIHASLPESVWENPGSDRPHLKAQHRKWITATVIRVLKDAGYTHIEDWLSLVLTGSLTTYQYGDESDCDVSLFVNAEVFPEWSRAEIIGQMITHVDGTTLPGTQYPMQCFVVPPEITPADLYKPGLRSGYDLKADDWIEPPDRTRAHDVQREMNMFYVYALEQADKMERLLRYEPDKAVILWHQIHKKRQRDQKAGKGDYSESNIVYKFLANRGLLPAISDASGEYIAAQRDVPRDNSDRGDHIWQLRSEGSLGYERRSQSKSSFDWDLDGGRLDIRDSDYSRSARIDRPAPVSGSLYEPSSEQPEQASSLRSSSHSNDASIRPPSSSHGDSRSRTAYSSSESHSPSSRNREEASQVYSENRSSYQLEAEVSENVAEFPQISQVSGEYIASAPEEPPNYRKGSAKEHCGACKMFFEGKCWGYGNKPVGEKMVCDSFYPEAKESATQPRTVTKFVYDPHANHLVIGKTGAEEGEHESHFDLLNKSNLDPSNAIFGQFDPSGRVETFGRPLIRGFGQPDMNQYEADYRLKQALEHAVPGVLHEAFEPPHSNWEQGPPNITYLGEPPLVTPDEPNKSAPEEGTWRF
jgi:hypothetical protein